jgi:hypothetical protein
VSHVINSRNVEHRSEIPGVIQTTTFPIIIVKNPQKSFCLLMAHNSKIHCEFRSDCIFLHRNFIKKPQKYACSNHGHGIKIKIRRGDQHQT